MGVVTLTWTGPAVAPAGEVMVRLVALITLRLVPALLSNLTAVAPVNPVPVTVTTVSPATGPTAGERLLTVGAATYVNRSTDEVALVPPGVVTLTSTVPTVPGGEMTMMWASSVTVTGLVLDTEPNLTAVTKVNPVPVIVTAVPPLAGPLVGAMPLTVGAATYVNWSAGVIALVPPGVMTLTSTVPAVPAGEVAVILVAEFTVKAVAAVFPKLTAVTSINPVPLIVTAVPAAKGPCAGEMLVIIGAAIYVNSSAGEGALVTAEVVTVTWTVPAVPAGEMAVI